MSALEPIFCVPRGVLLEQEALRGRNHSSTATTMFNLVSRIINSFFVMGWMLRRHVCCFRPHFLRNSTC